MYTRLSYLDVFSEVFLCGSLVAANIVLLGYRLLAASRDTQLRHVGGRYTMFYLAIAAVAPFAYPFDDVSYIRGLYLFVMLSAYVLVAGAIEAERGASCSEVLMSFAVETALFPLWYDMVFNVLLGLDLI